MAIIGLVISVVMYVAYFCTKYTFAARAVSYSSNLSFKDVWNFSFDGHPMRRSIVPAKYIAMFFAFTGLFGWGHIHQEDLLSLWKPLVMLLAYLNIWARMEIYNVTHKKEDDVKKFFYLSWVLKRSIKEIGWFPQSTNWLSRVVYVTGVLFLLVGILRFLYTLLIWLGY